MTRILCLLTGLFALTACATPPFALEGINQSITPGQTRGNTAYINKRVLWGGTIIATTPMKDLTRIEILAYAHDKKGIPLQSSKPHGRFYLDIPGFADPAVYASGRWISATGTVQANLSGRVGDAEYLYPHLKADQVHLWPEEQDSQGNSRVRFGIGIGIRL